mmetsp:Transcript_30579/g.97763  ORF Transcript_30579/g.97763 Transcript_30579/m.97763 type:complete len:249 (+) Transcript_30579:238-984(+)
MHGLPALLAGKAIAADVIAGGAVHDFRHPEVCGPGPRATRRRLHPGAGRRAALRPPGLALPPQKLHRRAVGCAARGERRPALAPEHRAPGRCRRNGHGLARGHTNGRATTLAGAAAHGFLSAGRHGRGPQLRGHAEGRQAPFLRAEGADGARHGRRGALLRPRAAAPAAGLLPFAGAGALPRLGWPHSLGAAAAHGQVLARHNDRAVAGQPHLHAGGERGHALRVRGAAAAAVRRPLGELRRRGPGRA